MSDGFDRDGLEQDDSGAPSGEDGAAAERGQSRGERYDEQSGGGRGPESVSFDRERDGALPDEE